MDTSSLLAARCLLAALLPFAAPPSLAQWPLCLAVQRVTVSDAAVLAAAISAAAASLLKTASGPRCSALSPLSLLLLLPTAAAAPLLLMVPLRAFGRVHTPSRCVGVQSLCVPLCAPLRTPQRVLLHSSVGVHACRCECLPQWGHAWRRSSGLYCPCRGCRTYRSHCDRPRCASLCCAWPRRVAPHRTWFGRSELCPFAIDAAATAVRRAPHVQMCHAWSRQSLPYCTQERARWHCA